MEFSPAASGIAWVLLFFILHWIIQLLIVHLLIEKIIELVNLKSRFHLAKRIDADIKPL